MDKKLQAHQPENLKVTNFVSKSTKSKLFDINKFAVPISEQESRVLSLICLLFSFTESQIDILSNLEQDENIVIDPVDEIQMKLIEKSEIMVTRIKKNIGNLFE